MLEVPRLCIWRLTVGVVHCSAPQRTKAPYWMFTTLLISLPLALLQAPEQRPGLVAIPGGPTVIGAEMDATIQRIREMPAAASVLAGEAPRNKQQVGDFFISPTLVTNEMYLEFVTATGAMPPPAWATISSDLRAELIQAGKNEFGPSYKFDEETKARWWELNWQKEGRLWEMNPAIALEPVVSISFMDAEGYCGWAGLRLPTEPEWVRAARGDSEFDYPFGKDFDPELISHNATQPSSLAYKMLPVCSMENASSYGVYDMVGLIHEFTNSRALKLEGWKSFSLQFKDAKGKVTENIYPSPTWDSNRILIKGGSYRNQATNCRIDTRIGFDRDASASIVGFRVAASAQPIVDSASLRCLGLRSAVLGGTPRTALNFNMAIGVEKHSVLNLDAVAAKRAPHEDVKEVNLPASYAVFGPHTSLSVTPLKDPFEHDDHNKLNVIDKSIRKSGRLIPLAALYTDVQLNDFDVPKGAYVLVYIPSMKNKDIESWGGWVKGMERKVEEDAAQPPLEGDPENMEEPDGVDGTDGTENGKPVTPPDGEQDPGNDSDKKKAKGKKGKKDEESAEPKPKSELSVDISGVPLIPNRPHILIVNSENVALAALPLIGQSTYKKDKLVAHGVTFRKQEGDKITEALIFNFKVPGSRGNAYGFSFALTPRDENGASICNPAHWNALRN